MIRMVGSKDTVPRMRVFSFFLSQPPLYIIADIAALFVVRPAGAAARGPDALCLHCLLRPTKLLMMELRIRL